MPKIVNISNVKILWEGYEIIGKKNTALFACPKDTEISLPDPCHICFESEPTTHGNRYRAFVQDSDRTLDLNVVAEDSELSCQILAKLYRQMRTGPLKVVSIAPKDEGKVIAQYDSAILATRPTISSISDGFAQLHVIFSVGVDSDEQ